MKGICNQCKKEKELTMSLPWGEYGELMVCDKCANKLSWIGEVMSI